MQEQVKKMRVVPGSIAVRDIVKDYLDENESGVTAYGGNLSCRPPYQREFVYDDKKRNAVIDTIINNLPLNTFHWVDRGEEFDDDDAPRYEILDGQQRTLSICKYVNGDFTIDYDGNQMSFNNLPDDVRNKILDYELLVYFIEDGTESTKLKWFRTINIAGEKLTDQELRNAVYAGPWVTHAKRFFSKTGCPASSVAEKYLRGKSIRQEYLETAIMWAASSEHLTIDEYMSKHQHDRNATNLWTYFSSVITWVENTFSTYRKEMKGQPWGLFYNNNKDRSDLDAEKVEKCIKELLADVDVSSKRGVYDYILNGNESALSIRSFDDRVKHAVYEKQNHKCAKCGKEFDYSDMEGDHITPWSQGGKTVESNCQMLCKNCNRTKSDK